MILNPTDFQTAVLFAVIILTTGLGFYFDSKAYSSKNASTPVMRIATHVIWAVDAVACICSLVFLFSLS